MRGLHASGQLSTALPQSSGHTKPDMLLFLVPYWEPHQAPTAADPVTPTMPINFGFISPEMKHSHREQQIVRNHNPVSFHEHLRMLASLPSFQPHRMIHDFM